MNKMVKKKEIKNMTISEILARKRSITAELIEINSLLSTLLSDVSSANTSPLLSNGLAVLPPIQDLNKEIYPDLNKELYQDIETPIVSITKTIDPMESMGLDSITTTSTQVE